MEDLSPLLVFVASLSMLVKDDEPPTTKDRRFLKPVIFFNPLRSPEYLFFSMSDSIEGTTEADGLFDDRLDRLVPGLCSLDAQDVGAVDCDMMEPRLVGSEETVVADKDDVILSTLFAICDGDIPRSWTSRARLSSISSSEVVGSRRRTVRR